MYYLGPGGRAKLTRASEQLHKTLQGPIRETNFGLL
jgi:hypothetical protein